MGGHDVLRFLIIAIAEHDGLNHLLITWQEAVGKDASQTSRLMIPSLKEPCP